MARHPYVTKGYSNYNERESGYAYEPEQNVNWFVVETTTIERVRVPGAGYTKGGAPLIHESIKEYMPKYAPKNHNEGYERNYGSSYENSSPTHYHEVENIMANFLNKIQIEASRPTNEHRSTSPDMYRHTSLDRHRPTSPNRYRPTSPDKYRPTSPDRYRPTSSNNHHTSPEKYHRTCSDNYRSKSPNKYRYTSPNKYRHTSPNKYRHTSPMHNYPSKGNHMPWPQPLSSPNKYQSTNSTKFGPTSPTNTRPTSPTNYRPTSPTNYRHTSPTRSYPPKEGHLIRAQNNQSSNYRPTSPTHTFPSNESQSTRTKRLSSPNKHLPSNPSTDEARYTRSGNFLGPNNRWYTEGLPASRHPRMTPTNDINEALRFLVDSVDYPTWSDPKKAGVNNSLSHGAHTIEHERHYSSYAFRSATTQPYLRRLIVKKP